MDAKWISKTEMDETSSGYSSRGESHPEEFSKASQGSRVHKPHPAFDGVKDTISNTDNKITDTADDIFHRLEAHKISDPGDNANLNTDTVVSNSALKRDRGCKADSPCFGSHSEDCLYTDHLKQKKCRLRKGNLAKGKNLDCVTKKSTEHSKPALSASDNDSGILIQKLLSDNIALRRQFISSQQLFYHIIDDLKARLVEAECYSKMVGEQLKEYKRVSSCCTCRSEVKVETTKCIQRDNSCDCYSKTEGDRSVASEPSDVSSTIYRQSSPIVRKAKSADNITLLKMDNNDSESWGSQNSNFLKQTLQERNQQLQQQIKILKGSHGQPNAPKTKGYEDSCAMPNLVSSSYFTTAARPKSSFRYPTKHTEKKIAVGNVKWIKKPPSAKKRPPEKLLFNTQLGFRTINVHKWSSDYDKR